MIFLVASWLARQQGEAIEYLRAENRVLRGRLGPKRLRFTDAERRLLAERGRPLGRKRLAGVALLGTPRTILRWYREKVAAKYDGSRARPAAGRPRSPDDRVGQLLTMARENPSWGYTRLLGALMNLGLDLGRSTITRILKDNGIQRRGSDRRRPGTVPRAIRDRAENALSTSSSTGTRCTPSISGLFCPRRARRFCGCPLAVRI